MNLNIKEWKHNLGILEDGTGVIKEIDNYHCREPRDVIVFITKEATEIAKGWNKKIGVKINYDGIVKLQATPFKTAQICVIEDCITSYEYI